MCSQTMSYVYANKINKNHVQVSFLKCDPFCSKTRLRVSSLIWKNCLSTNIVTPACCFKGRYNFFWLIHFLVQ